MYEVIASRYVQLGGNSIVKAIGMDSTVVEVATNRKINKIHIKNVLHVHKLHENLFL